MKFNWKNPKTYIWIVIILVVILGIVKMMSDRKKVAAALKTSYPSATTYTDAQRTAVIDKLKKEGQIWKFWA